MSEKKSIEICNNEIPVIDMQENVWIINVKNPDLEDEINNNMRQACIDNKFFAMCWVSGVENLEKPEENTLCRKLNYDIKINKLDIDDNKLKDPESDKYLSNCKPGAITAFNAYKMINKNDYILWTFDSHYYIGKVESEIEYLGGTKEIDYKISKEFTWGCRVHKWIEFANDTLLPTIITGRLSQQHQSTITRVAGKYEDLKIYTKYLYEHYKDESKDKNIKVNETDGSEIENKIIINESNFARCLNYMGLEDLVYLYILNQKGNEDYYLVPSSCKISKEKYEFNLLSKSGKFPITCQVKNQHDLNYDDYISDAESYKNIYLFSGIGVKNTPNDTGNIVVISDKDLYDFLNTKAAENIRNILKKWYIFSENKELDYDKIEATVSRVENNAESGNRSKNHPLKIESGQYIVGLHFNSYYLHSFRAIIRYKETDEKNAFGSDSEQRFENFKKLFYKNAEEVLKEIK